MGWKQSKSEEEERKKLSNNFACESCAINLADNLRNHLLTRRPPVANERVAEMQICERKNFARKFIANYFKLC